MKKIRLFALMVILPVFCFADFEDDSDSWNDCDAFEVCLPCAASNVEITVGALFLRPSSGNLGWAVVTDFPSLVTPTWHIKTLDPDYHYAVNVGVRYIFSRFDMDAQLNWTHLRTCDSQSVSVTPALQWVSPFFQTGPGTAETTYSSTGVGQLTEAHGCVEFQYDVVNVDIGTFVCMGSNMQMRIFSGLTGVRIEQQLISTFESANSLPKISLNNTSIYTGIGPRLGFDCSYGICNCFNFVGQLGAALLFGKMEPAEFLFSGSSASLAAMGITSNNETISSKSVFQAVPAIDVKLGLSYAYYFWKCYLLTIEVGYRGAIYINALSGYEANTNVLSLELGSLSINSMKHTQSDFSVDGPYLTLNLKF